MQLEEKIREKTFPTTTPSCHITLACILADFKVELLCAEPILARRDGDVWLAAVLPPRDRAVHLVDLWEEAADDVNDADDDENERGDELEDAPHPYNWGGAIGKGARPRCVERHCAHHEVGNAATPHKVAVEGRERGGERGGEGGREKGQRG